MFYTIYKITNTVNGKYYIGKHQTKDLNDGYMGSGKLLKRAISKYGCDNFTKEILHVFQTEQEMNDKEKELVTLHEMSYNLCPGGKGGFGYINSSIWTEEKRLNHNRKYSGVKLLSKEERQKYGKMGAIARANQITQMTDEEKKQVFANISFKGKHHTEETKEKVRSKMKGRVPWNKGIPRTEEEKKKISRGVKNTLL